MKDKVKKGFDSFEKIICVILMAVLFFILFCQTLFRNIGIDAVWTDESARYLFVLLTYVGAGLAMLFGKHVKIDIMISVWPKKLRPYIETLGTVISILFCAFVVFETFDYNVHTVLAGGRLSATLQIPIGIPYLAVSLGYLLMFIREIEVELIPQMKTLFGKKQTADNAKQIEEGEK